MGEYSGLQDAWRSCSYMSNVTAATIFINYYWTSRPSEQGNILDCCADRAKAFLLYLLQNCTLMGCYAPNIFYFKNMDFSLQHELVEIWEDEPVTKLNIDKTLDSLIETIEDRYDDALTKEIKQLFPVPVTEDQRPDFIKAYTKGLLKFKSEVQDQLRVCALLFTNHIADHLLAYDYDNEIYLLEWANEEFDEHLELSRYDNFIKGS